MGHPCLLKPHGVRIHNFELWLGNALGFGHELLQVVLFIGVFGLLFGLLLVLFCLGLLLGDVSFEFCFEFVDVHGVNDGVFGLNFDCDGGWFFSFASYILHNLVIFGDRLLML